MLIAVRVNARSRRGSDSGVVAGRGRFATDAGKAVRRMAERCRYVTGISTVKVELQRGQQVPSIS
jgi:hypothetical protein